MTRNIYNPATQIQLAVENMNRDVLSVSKLHGEDKTNAIAESNRYYNTLLVEYPSMKDYFIDEIELYQSSKQTQNDIEDLLAQVANSLTKDLYNTSDMTKTESMTMNGSHNYSRFGSALNQTIELNRQYNKIYRDYPQVYDFILKVTDPLSIIQSIKINQPEKEDLMISCLNQGCYVTLILLDSWKVFTDKLRNYILHKAKKFAQGENYTYILTKEEAFEILEENEQYHYHKKL